MLSYRSLSRKVEELEDSVNHKVIGNVMTDELAKSKKQPRKGRVSLAQVAEAAGVSKMTASRVLNNSTGFSDATRTKVMDQVDRLGYVQNRLAAAFSSDSASTYVGVSIPDLGNEVFSQVLDGIERKLNSYGYQAVLCVSQHDTASVESWIETVLSWRPAGLIITGRNHSERARSLIKSGGVPVVEIWDLNASPMDMCVGVSMFDSGYAMGRYMLETGHRKLGYIGTHHDLADAAQARYNGWRKAIQDGAGEVVHTHMLPDTPGFYSGFYATEQFFGHTTNVDALYFQNDNMATGGLMYCQSNIHQYIAVSRYRVTMATMDDTRTDAAASASQIPQIFRLRRGASSRRGCTQCQPSWLTGKLGLAVWVAGMFAGCWPPCPVFQQARGWGAGLD